jgi:hypothetical protein
MNGSRALFRILARYQQQKEMHAHKKLKDSVSIHDNFTILLCEVILARFYHQKSIHGTWCSFWYQFQREILRHCPWGIDAVAVWTIAVALVYDSLLYAPD